MTTKRRILVFSVLAIIGCVALLSTKVDYHFNDDIDGFFLLEGENGKWLEVTDDLTPEDAARLFWVMPLYPFKKIVTASNQYTGLDFRWNKNDGRGFIRNNWSDGRKLVINLGRFRESNGKYPSGLFIGGGLPPSDPDYRYLNNEATGMTYFDGKRWFHIWCNVNEGILSPASPFQPSYPSDWQFKGSWVRENDGTNLTIESRHRIMLAGVPLDFNRFLFYTSGSKYVILTTELTNRGTVPSSVQYQYGDEPWIGNFGSSAGDVGWIKNELLFTEREIDVTRNSFVGMFDYGNPLAGEAHTFTGVANFIEWEKATPPDKVYVSNFSGGIMHGSKLMPLTSTTNRVLGLQWGPRTLAPGESFSFSIAVGMADSDPKTGMPTKPATEMNH